MRATRTCGRTTVRDTSCNPTQPVPLPAGNAATDPEVQATRVPRLVCRLYGAATPALRAKLVACLLRPLGTLGTVGVAAGAFGVFLYRGGSESARAVIGDVAQFSTDQMFELARFVEQVSPDSLQEFAQLIAQRPMGIAAFSASAALLLMRALRQRSDVGEARVVETATPLRSPPMA